jgi:hypothetical protein
VQLEQTAIWSAAAREQLVKEEKEQVENVLKAFLANAPDADALSLEDIHDEVSPCLIDMFPLLLCTAELLAMLLTTMHCVSQILCAVYAC